VPLGGGWKPLRIAVVTEYYYPHLGGICEHVFHFTREARRRGHAVDVITSLIPGTPAEEGVIRLGRSMPIYINGSHGRFTVGANLRREMKAILRGGGYDLVHVHSPLTPVLPLIAIDAAEVPIVGTFHTYFERSLGYRVFRQALQDRLGRLSAAIAVSPSTVVALERYFEADWTIIPNGIDTDSFRPDATAPAALDGDVPSILFLGRFDPRNGLSTLIAAFKHLKSWGRRARLVVVGDGPLRLHYRSRAGSDPDILFVGPVLEGRPGYYANSAVYACPTTKASFGITLLEAMACRTPIVCSDILGFRDVVSHGREALMVPRDDSRALALALARLLEDDALRARLGATGRERALAYDWSNVTTSVLSVYRAVLGHEPVALAV
jgi:phosphatidylinositol alpha-mannosyltransferase